MEAFNRLAIKILQTKLGQLSSMKLKLNLYKCTALELKCEFRGGSETEKELLLDTKNVQERGFM